MKRLFQAKKGMFLARQVELTTSKGQTWIWCTNKEGLSGWVAESILVIHQVQAVLKEDFDALELTVKTAEVVQGSRQLVGWLWLRNTQGELG